MIPTFAISTGFVPAHSLCISPLDPVQPMSQCELVFPLHVMHILHKHFFSKDPILCLVDSSKPVCLSGGNSSETQHLLFLESSMGPFKRKNTSSSFVLITNGVMLSVITFLHPVLLEKRSISVSTFHEHNPVLLPQ